MTAMKHIRGILTMSNSEAMNGKTRDSIMRAVFKHGLGLIIKDVRLDGTVEIDSHTTAFGGRNAALEYIGRMTSALNEAEVAKLQFTGSVLVTVTSDKEPVIFRVNVENGVVTKEEAALVWGKD